MGGPGSTRWKGTVVHDVTERYARLCAHDLCLKPGTAGRIEDLGLGYIVPKPGDKIMLWGASGIHEAALTRTPCPHTGGQTIYFRCPGCGRRVAILYAREGTTFRCRHCWDLHYACQQERPRKRAERRLKKLFEKMGQPWLGRPAFPPDKKPKWMFARTFSRLRNKYITAALDFLSEMKIARSQGRGPAC
jgi:hypothetical protein